MKFRFTSVLVVCLGLAAVSSPAFAASKKEIAAAKTAALVAALQSVSPDPLGGRLGLAATAARSESAPATASTANPSDKGVTRFDLDQRAYVIWKSSQKS